MGGILASRLGTTFTSILATGLILLGKICLLCGNIWKIFGLMTVGLFIFGLGVSPLAVVQKIIIIRFFKSHGLGVSMAFGLIAARLTSFISARTSYPLTERFGSHAPFFVSTFLALLSVLVNLVYVISSKWLIDGAGAELEAPDISEEARRRLAINLSEAQALKRVAEKRKVYLRQIANLGDLFWAYLCFNFFYGMIWSPFPHLAANIIERCFKLSEENAAITSSYLLVGSVFFLSVVWLHRGPPESSSNRNPTPFPIFNINHGGLFLVRIATDLDANALARYFPIRSWPRLLSSSVLET